MTAQQAREVDSALALEGLDRKSWAARAGKSYGRVIRMLNAVETPTTDYAEAFNAVRQRARLHFTRAAA